MRLSWEWKEGMEMHARHKAASFILGDHYMYLYYLGHSQNQKNLLASKATEAEAKSSLRIAINARYHLQQRHAAFLYSVPVIRQKDRRKC